MFTTSGCVEFPLGCSQNKIKRKEKKKKESIALILFLSIVV
jgi:hypothetical protein